MKSVAEILQLSSDFLKNKKIERSARLAEELLAHVLKCRKIDLYLQYDRPLVSEELEAMRGFVRRLVTQEPIDYLIGEVEFFGAKIKVDSRVLIPRPETEILVDWMAAKIGRFPALDEKVLWDVCTGSGCIGISLKKKFQSLRVALSDLSEQALEVAKQNKDLNQVDVEIRLGDLLTPFLGQKADFFVCNPPYVTTAEYFSLDSSVKDFEPKIALLAGDRGVEFYERLEKELPLFLNHGALVFFEIGSTQGAALKKIFSAPIWTTHELHLDWSGRERFFFLEMQ